MPQICVFLLWRMHAGTVLLQGTYCASKIQLLVNFRRARGVNIYKPTVNFTCGKPSRDQQKRHCESPLPKAMGEDMLFPKPGRVFKT